MNECMVRTKFTRKMTLKKDLRISFNSTVLRFFGKMVHNFTFSVDL